MKTHPLRCRCGTLQGVVQVSRSANRALCYCADCQAYARFLDASVLDASGGTEVVAMTPRHVRFVSGLASLACLSLSPRGLLRWYAQCCRTPIGNTPRNHRLAYVGLMHCCLGDEAAREASFGPVRIAVNTKSARGPVPSLPVASRVRAMLALTRSLAGAPAVRQLSTVAVLRRRFACPGARTGRAVQGGAGCGLCGRRLSA